MTSRGAYRKPSPTISPTTLGGRIRAIRTAWRWTQTQFAECFHVDQQMVSLWERDKTKPSRTGMALLSRLSGLSLDALTTGKGFTIPDLPPAVDQAPSTSLISVSLPPAPSGEAVLVELPAGKGQVISGKEAAAFVRDLAKTGRTFWVVYGGDSRN